MELLNGVVRDYAWGSRTAIPALLGLEADGGPQAELWLGAHPGAPAVAGDEPLDALVERDPAGLLGARVRERFGDRLPFLLKVLAAEQPLSVQVHPSEEQAREGFAREDAEGVPRDAAHRSYKDPHHKPEMVVALTPFEALCGFRDPAVSRAALQRLDVPALTPLLDVLDDPDPEAALRGALALLLGGEADLEAMVEDATAACGDVDPDAGDVDPDRRTVAELAAHFPGDPGVLVALLLHRVRLEPGEAVWLPAGNVHAYLHGTGVELMAASDNVLRGGLTPKHVDVAELRRVVDHRPVPVPRVVPVERAGARVWRPGPDELELWQLHPDGGAPVDGPADGPRVVLCTEGRVDLATDGGALRLARGGAALVRDDDGPLRVGGEGVVWVAAVPA